MTPRFEPAAVTDAAAHALLTEYFEHRAQGFPAAQGSYSTTYPDPRDFVPPNGVFLLVLDEGGEGGGGGADGGRGAAVGCGGIRRLDAPAGIVRFEVKHLWMQPRTQGRGFGRALLGELERRAREWGATELVLDTNSSLRAADGLYRSSGFAEVEPYNDNPNATTWFAKPLGRVP
ncbi:GNAT family N-acetyltransferase [Compostimonas suwonensis]|uniref:Acetyltransferase (GNAT) family protein n=1 Tax=Compostimonas suwonensis TaxID=1048394 RepID=A0A2M9BTU0_9MICO|nr:GNAT family N-acetyltransferase [Compostimonas suwonensis]PJJ61356.1 acetyltransferase (GNAT) family protein [Compostimonas suwonensis]